jgi:hypothetical protein
MMISIEKDKGLDDRTFMDDYRSDEMMKNPFEMNGILITIYNQC